mmetsp:Transcript_19926/g.46538  ORF Transcript_19926/g.46538 Transcript_19926/m.46538 type:complete len:94 (-) Transcript_19926:193-474(-)
MDWRPPVRNIMIAHSDGDMVISASELKRVAEVWNAPYVSLRSAVSPGERGCWGDDIHHDFLARDLIAQVVTLFQEFLQRCETTPPDSASAREH